MADDPSVTPGGEDAPASGEPAATGPATPRQPSAAAAAASRARRIGGRGVAASASPKPEPAAEPVKPVREGRRPPKPAPEPVSVAKAAAPQSFPAPPGYRAAPAGPAIPEWLRWLPATVLTVASLVMVVVLVVASHGVWWNRPADSTVRQQVLAAAKTCVSKTNTYNYQDLDAYERNGLQCATGVYTSQFRQAVEKIIKKNAPTLKAVQSTQINTAAIEAITKGGQWSLLIFGQIKVTNSNYPDGRTDPFGAVARMEKVHGKWLISGLKTVSSPVASGG